jgi:hypothetical protein
MNKKPVRNGTQFSPHSPVACYTVTPEGRLRPDDSEVDMLQLRPGDIVLVQRDTNAFVLERIELRKAVSEFQRAMAVAEVSLFDVLSNMPVVHEHDWSGTSSLDARKY